MKVVHINRYFVLAILLACSQSVFAVETIEWEGLVPPLDLAGNTYSTLDKNLERRMSELLLVRKLRAAGGSSKSLKYLENKAHTAFQDAGIDVEQLLKDMEEFDKQSLENDNKLVTELNGKTIRMPGYVLPTEFSGTLVVEFLLVPYVGACVHTPPPPANQIVHVKVDKGFESEGLFMPVWVTGKISTAMTRQALRFDDGATDVDAGYSIAASNVIPYE